MLRAATLVEIVREVEKTLWPSRKEFRLVEKSENSYVHYNQHWVFSSYSPWDLCNSQCISMLSWVRSTIFDHRKNWRNRWKQIYRWDFDLNDNGFSTILIPNLCWPSTNRSRYYFVCGRESLIMRKWILTWVSVAMLLRRFRSTEFSYHIFAHTYHIYVIRLNISWITDQTRIFIVWIRCSDSWNETYWRLVYAGHLGLLIPPSPQVK